MVGCLERERACTGPMQFHLRLLLFLLFFFLPFGHTHSHIDPATPIGFLFYFVFLFIIFYSFESTTYTFQSYHIPLRYPSFLSTLSTTGLLSSLYLPLCSTCTTTFIPRSFPSHIPLSSFSTHPRQTRPGPNKNNTTNLYAHTTTNTQRYPLESRRRHNEHCSSLIQVQQYLQRLLQPCRPPTTSQNSRHGPNGHLHHPPHKTRSSSLVLTTSATTDDAATATAKTSAGSQDAIVRFGGYYELSLWQEYEQQSCAFVFARRRYDNSNHHSTRRQEQ